MRLRPALIGTFRATGRSASGWLCVAGLLLSAVTALAAPSLTESLRDNWRWVAFTTASGLPSNRVMAVVETSDGTVWARTARGLAWFDGYRWTAVGADRGLPAGFAGSAVPFGSGELLVATAGRLYLGGQSGFREVTAATVGRPLPVGAVTSHPLRPGVALILAEGGTLHDFDGRSVQPSALGEAMGGLPVVGLVEASPGVLVATVQGGVFEWRSTTRRRQLVAEGRNPWVPPPAVCAGKDTWAYVKAPASIAGLWRIDADRTVARMTPPGYPAIDALACSADGEVVAVHGNGELSIHRYDAWTRLDPLPRHLLNVLFLSFRSNGDLWVGTEQGLHLHRRSSRRWRYVLQSRDDSRNNVNDLLRLRDGSLAAAFDEGVVIQRPDGSVDHITRVDGKPLVGTTSVGEDGQGNLWASSGGSYLGVVTRQAGRWHWLAGGPLLASASIHRIRPDRRGRTWLVGWFDSNTDARGVGRTGSAVFVLEDGRPIPFDPALSLPASRVYGFGEGPEGALWFGTDAGLFRWSDSRWTAWTTREGLKSNRVFSLTVDDTGRVWFVDQSHGLGCIEDERVSYQTTEDGLINDAVWDVALDTSQRPWIATRGGLCGRMAGTWWTCFGSEAGLSNTRLWPILPLADRVLAGTLGQGVIALDLAETHSPAPRVFAGPAVVENRDVLVRWTVASYWGQTPEDAIQVRHRLDGQDWSPWRTSREAVFAGLPSGRHEVTLQARDMFSTVEAGGTAVAFTIPVPFHRRPGFVVPLTLLALMVTGLAVVWAVDRRRHARVLRDSEQRLRWVTSNAPVVLFAVDERGVFTVSSGLGLEKLGMEPDQAVGKRVEEAYGSFPEILDSVNRARRGELTHSIVQVRGRCWDTHFTPVRDTAGRPHGVIGVGVDITEHRLAEASLRASEERFRRAFMASPVPTAIGAAEGRLVDVNAAFERLTGYSRDELVGRTTTELGLMMHPFTLERLAELLRQHGGHMPNVEGRLRTRAGTEVSVLASLQLTEFGGQPVALMQVVDLTDYKRLEAQLRQAQKMEGVGRLAGGVAHDFNNLLTVILGNVELMEAQTSADDPRRAELEQVRTAGNRAVRLTRQLLTFARKQVVETRVLTLNEVVLNFDRMLRRLIGEDIEMVTLMAPGLWPVKADPGQLEQVLVNLAVNARDAMPGGGTLTVETANVDLDAPAAQSLGGLTPGPYVRLSVTDTGVGMDQATLGHLFEPFFTTKEPGKGTGLGLATCYGIVTQCGGHISARSKVGHGTTFDIYLPRAEGAGVVSDLGESPARERGGVETILLVEDEPQVRQLAAAVLRDRGYEVIEAATGSEALDIAARRDQPFDLLVTDLVMPQVGGTEVARRMRGRQPGLRILFVSGYTDNPAFRQEVLAERTAFLPKPFTPHQLAMKVREVLDLETR